MTLVIPPDLTEQGGDVTATATLVDVLQYGTVTLPVQLSLSSLGELREDGNAAPSTGRESFFFQFDEVSTSDISGDLFVIDDSDPNLPIGTFQLTLHQ
jgi:hypothetical protein